MIGEKFEMYIYIDGYQTARMAFKLSTMVVENFEIYTTQMSKNAYKFFTMFG